MNPAVLLPVLKAVWLASDQLCSKRLKPDTSHAFQSRIAEFSHPTKARSCRQCLEGFISRLDSPRRRIGIIIGNMFPNCPKLILDAGGRTNSATRFLHPFAPAAEHSFAIHTLASVQRTDRLHQLRFQFIQCGRQSHRPHFALFLEAAQASTNNFAGGLVKPAVHLLGHKFFQFQCQ